MNKAFEKILDRLEEENSRLKTLRNNCIALSDKEVCDIEDKAYNFCKQIVQEVAEEYNGGWIPCSDRLPEEHDSMFAKLKGTDKWSDAMFEKISDDVNVTVEFDDGTRKTMTLHTNDGKWNTNNRIVKFNVIAWQPLPKPFKERD